MIVTISKNVYVNDELILWSVFMTGSKTPGMSEKRSVSDITSLTIYINIVSLLLRYIEIAYIFQKKNKLKK